MERGIGAYVKSSDESHSEVGIEPTITQIDGKDLAQMLVRRQFGLNSIGTRNMRFMAGVLILTSLIMPVGWIVRTMRSILRSY